MALVSLYGYGSVPRNRISGGMNIYKSQLVPAILVTRGFRVSSLACFASPFLMNSLDGHHFWSLPCHQGARTTRDAPIAQELVLDLGSGLDLHLRNVFCHHLGESHGEHPKKSEKVQNPIETMAMEQKP